MSHAQNVETGFLDRTVTTAGHDYRYQVYVPTEYSSETSWPVILFLHGSADRGADGLLQTTVGLGPAIRRDPSRYPAIVVFPQVPVDSWWVGAPAEMAMAALTRTMGELRVDRTRVYLTGMSMGGHGTWHLAYRYPDLFAAVVPICGCILGSDRFPGSVPVVPPDSGAAISAMARRLVETPVWIFHGEMDTVVPASCSREAAAALEAVSADVRYTEYLGLGHNSWDATYASKEFTEWLFAQQRH